MYVFDGFQGEVVPPLLRITRLSRQRFRGRLRLRLRHLRSSGS